MGNPPQAPACPGQAPACPARGACRGSATQARRAPSPPTAAHLLALLLTALTLTPTARAVDPASPQVTDTAPQVSAIISDAPSPLDLLHDPQAAFAQRVAAARQLLTQPSQPEQRALLLALATSPDAGVQRAIAQALASMPNGPPQTFSPLLLDLLWTTRGQVQADVMVALARSSDPATQQRVRALAGDAKADLTLRKAAIGVLAMQRSRSVAAVLMGIVNEDRSLGARDAAFAGLGRVTGITNLGNDAVAWRAWWEKHRNLSDTAWTDSVFEVYARNQSQLAGQVTQLQDRLVETQRQFYRATATDKRPAMLVAMLGDTLEPIRLLGMELAVQSVGEQGPTGIVAEVRQAVLARLEDGSPSIRQRSALLLRDLADEAGADRVATLLARGDEQRPEVLRAYLLMMARLPRDAAVAAALNLLGDQTLRGEAAGTLAAAAEAGKLSARDAAVALQAVRAQLYNGQAPQPEVITLMGRIGKDGDWQRIGAWLDNKDPAVRQAAAWAWNRSDRPLLELTKRSEEPAILAILLDAAARRDNDPMVLGYLVDHKPDNDGLLQAWRRALIGMAGRVDAHSVARIDDTLAQRHEPIDLRRQMLSAVIDRLLEAALPAGADPAAGTPDPGTPGTPQTTDPASVVDPVLARLLLTRAELRLADNDPRLAMADVEQLAAIKVQLDAAQGTRLDWVTLQGRLALLQPANVLELATRLAGSADHQRDAAVTERIIGLFLTAAERSIATNQLDVARQVLGSLHTFCGPDIPAQFTQRVSDLQSLAGLPAPVPTPVPTPTPDTTPDTTPTVSAVQGPARAPATSAVEPAPTAPASTTDAPPVAANPPAEQSPPPSTNAPVAPRDAATTESPTPAEPKVQEEPNLPAPAVTDQAAPATQPADTNER
ncbi:MAG: hypothetical protein WD042_12295 [Phycisphaeraceae bacterium]